MNKEEFINFINSIDFKVIKNFTLTYVKKEQHSYNLNDEETKPKTITFGKDYEILINERFGWMNSKIDDLHRQLDEIIKGDEQHESKRIDRKIK